MVLGQREISCGQLLLPVQYCVDEVAPERNTFFYCTTNCVSFGENTFREGILLYRQVDVRLDCRASQRCPVSRRPMVGASCARSMCYQITNKHSAVSFHSTCICRRMPDLIDISARTSAPHRSQVCTKKSPWRSARRLRGRPERRCRPSTFCVTT